MSKERMSEFFQYGPQLDINATEYAVLCELSRHENEDTHVCCPSIPTLAYHCHTSRNTIINAIQYLQKMGILTIERRTDKTNRTTSHAYTIDIKGKIGIEHPKRKRPKKKKKENGTKFQPSQGTNFAPSQGSNFVPSTSVQNLYRNNDGSLNNCVPNNTNPNNTTPNPIQPHSPRAHAKDGTGFGGGVGRGALTNGLRKTGGIPKLSPLDTDGMPKGYPKEDEYLAFIESLLTDKGRKLWRSIRIEGQKNYRTICDRGWLDGQGRFISNWKQYARSCIAKAFETQPPTILKWDESLIVVTGMVPPSVAGLKPYSHPSEQAEQPQKSLPPPTKERKPNPKPEPPSVEIPAVEPPPPKRSTEEIIRADPTTFRTASVARLRLEREEAARRARAIAVSSGHAEGVYYRGNG